ncbi:MAG: hypothetical protein CML66_29780 [Rhodobacteraceae bacterium]|nr:hypothetical protein [Paracoccaceae bacterium]MAY44231.1 hypothetical protein [Paracoccaceae bacterium]QEW19298.1 Tellurite resistance protein [Marinibacterium anthonyi]
MLSNLIRRLSDPAPQRLSDEDARHALAALLVRVARTDGYYAPDEAEKIDRILAARYGMSPFEATALRRTAEEVEAGAPDTVRFTRTIKDAVPYEERLAIIEALWQVVLADGQRDAEEDALLRLVASLLGVNDLDSNMARRKAAGE